MALNETNLLQEAILDVVADKARREPPAVDEVYAAVRLTQSEARSSDLRTAMLGLLGQHKLKINKHFRLVRPDESLA